MWAAKLEGEGAVMYDCCQAMSKLMKEIGISIDGGKDSLSMAAKVNGEVVKVMMSPFLTSFINKLAHYNIYIGPWHPCSQCVCRSA